MLRKIRVYGKLAKFLGQRTFEAVVSSAAEAVRFLLVNFPELERHMAEQHYRVSVGTYALSEAELGDPVGQQTIKIIPVLAGAGRGVGQILIGAALIAASFFFPAAAGAAAALKIGASTFSAFGAGLFFTGAGLLLTGTAQLLTPTPTVSFDNNVESDPRESFNFSGIQNTSRAGTPVPIVYGEMVVGSVLVSLGIDTVRTAG